MLSSLCNYVKYIKARDLLENGHPKARFHLTLSEYLHVYGVNLRHLGLLRFCLLRGVRREWDKIEVVYNPPREATVDMDISSGFLFPKHTRATSDSEDSMLSSLLRRASDDSLSSSFYRSISQGSPRANTSDGRRSDSHQEAYAAWFEIQGEILKECLCRVLKNLLRRLQRDWMRRQRSSSDRGLLDQAAHFLNRISGTHKYSEDFWTKEVTVALQQRFGAISLVKFPNLYSKDDLDAIRPSEAWLEDCIDGNNQVSLISLYTLIRSDPGFTYSLIPRLCAMTGVRLSNECEKQFDAFCRALSNSGNTPTTRSKQFEFVAADIEELVPVIKHMHQLELAEGLMLSLMAEQRQAPGASPEDLQVALRLVTMATQRLHRALTAVPDDHKTRHALADAYQTEGYTCQRLSKRLQNMSDDIEISIGEAETLQKSSFSLKHRSSRAFRSYALLKHDLEHTYCGELGLSCRGMYIMLNISFIESLIVSNPFKLNMFVQRI